jgi:UrcA family protein
MRNNKVGALLLCTFVTLSAVAANAKTSEDALPGARVAYADLNLASSEGSEALQRRVARAVATLCARPIANWKDKLDQRQCENKALEEARPQVQLAIRNANQAFAMRDTSGAILLH